MEYVLVNILSSKLVQHSVFFKLNEDMSRKMETFQPLFLVEYEQSPANSMLEFRKVRNNLPLDERG